MPHLLTHMPHFLPKHTAPEVNTAASAAGSNQHHHWRSTVAATASHIHYPHLPLQNRILGGRTPIQQETISR